MSAPPPAALPEGAKVKLSVVKGLRVGKNYALKEGVTYIGRQGPTSVDVDLTEQENPGVAVKVNRFALVWYDNPYAFCSLLFVVKFFGDWSLATSWGVVTDIGGRATASVFAFNNAVAGIGFIAAPPIFGFVAQHYGWPAVFATVAAANNSCFIAPSNDDRRARRRG